MTQDTLRERLSAPVRQLPVWSPEVEAPSASPQYAPLLIVAAGLALVCAAYALGRQQRPHAQPLYWFGELLILAPIIAGVLSRRSGDTQRTFLLVLLSACQSFLVWAYSPLRFTFPDELQHLRTASDIVRTHHLFTPNSYLPVSPGFPGLEIVTTGLSSVTGLSVTICGWLVASLSHVLLTVAVLRLYQRVLGVGIAASLAALVYAANPHGSYFNSLFVYAALALPFLAFAVRVALQPAGRYRSSTFALLPLLVAVVTHHLTALAGTAIIVALAGVLLVIGEPRRRPQAWTMLLLGANGLILTIAWTALTAPATFDYLGKPLLALTQSFGQGGGSDAVPASVAAAPPRWESAISAGSVLATLFLLTVGIMLLRRRGEGSRFPLAFALLSSSYLLVLGVRVLASDGAELAARGLTYVMLLVAVPAAVTLAHMTRDGARRSPRVLALLLAVTLFAGGITIGLPPWWERVPGRFRIAAFESGHDQSVELAGRWAAQHLAPGAKMASDVSLGGVLASYARADLSTDAAAAFYDPSVQGKREVLRRLSLQYVFVDRRMTQQIPITGSYFPNDQQADKHDRPLPEAALEPLDRDPLVDRIYDNGSIQGYATGRAWTQ